MPETSFGTKTMMDSDTQFDSAARRTLAAIVFTDIANASQLMGEDEDHALQLVGRDLEIIRGLCGKHSGRVLKSTGDGLLMYFSSAVQAVACALEVQGSMGQQAKTLSAGDVLMHRIGIHLGDVFVSESDVMGDGVNIAARLQSEAEPGGICISETVYDVVKNRLALKATYLGPRELKNIKDAVPVYQILLDAAGGQGKLKSAGKAKAIFHMKPWLWVMTGLLVVICLASAAVVYHLFFKTEEGVNGYQTAPAGAAGGRPAARRSQADPDQARIDVARRTYIPRYDFSGMVQWLEKNGLKSHQAYDRYSKLRDLKQSTRAMLMQTSASKPLRLEADSGHGTAGSQLWASGSMFVLKDALGQREMRFEEFSPSLFQNVVAAVLRTNAGLSGNPKLREAQQILAEELAGER